MPPQRPAGFEGPGPGPGGPGGRPGGGGPGGPGGQAGPPAGIPMSADGVMPMAAVQHLVMSKL